MAMNYLIQEKVDDVNAIEGDDTIRIVEDGYGTASVYVKETFIAGGVNEMIVNVIVSTAWAMTRR
ncbi:MAG: hypothetical protein DRO87_12430 [Candidatus Thorarchaeota archaeon]|nr:MAG: hypothetical protein DRO87_12430 [Candidatus Thorarchaeota archaeon]